MKMDFGNICRLCLGDKNLLPLFQDETLPPRIMTVAPFMKISLGDGYPCNICEMCVENVNAAFRFRVQCEISCSALEKYLKDEQLEKVLETEDVCSLMKSFTVPCSEAEGSSEDLLPSMRTWSVLLQCKNIGKDLPLIQALQEILMEYSKDKVPDFITDKDPIPQMDVILKVPLDKCNGRRRVYRPIKKKKELEDEKPPLIDIVSDDEDAVSCVEDSVCRSAFVKLQRSALVEEMVRSCSKKSCLKRRDSDGGCSTSHMKRVRFQDCSEFEDTEARRMIEELSCCERCKSCQSHLELMQHMQEHAPSFDITCAYCGVSYKDPTLLSSHLGGRCVRAEPKRKGSSGLNMCAFCNQQFHRPSLLLKHIKTHFPYNSTEG